VYLTPTFIVLGLDSKTRTPPIEEVTSLSHRLQGPLRHDKIMSTHCIGQVSSDNTNGLLS
jgi:hypothetical protein